MTTMYTLYQRPVETSESDDSNGTVEVPSWRILPVSGQNISRREIEEVSCFQFSLDVDSTMVPFDTVLIP